LPCPDFVASYKELSISASFLRPSSTALIPAPRLSVQLKNAISGLFLSDLKPIALSATPIGGSAISSVLIRQEQAACARS
jgi:hypothetical protein